MNATSRVLLTSLWLLCNMLLSAAPTDFEGANALYRAEQYRAAAEAYEQLLAEGEAAPTLFYNLGNAYYRLGEVGPAVYAYERGLLLSPGDADLRYNLRFVRQESGLPLQSSLGAVITWQTIAAWFSPDVWAYIGLALLWLAVGSLAVWRLAGVRQVRKRGLIIGAGLLLLCTLPFGLSYSRYQALARADTAVVLYDNVPIKSAADANSAIIERSRAGSRVEVLDRIGVWYKLELDNGTVGWMQQDDLGMIGNPTD